jgi:RimJ/RimL family protein N-acetyltransferase
MITGDKIRIRDKKLEDAVNDYNWSRDPELSRLDAAQPLVMSLSHFISEFSAELRYPSLTRRRFAVDTTDGLHIGNCSYYNIDLKRSEAEIGIMIGNRDYWNKGYGTDIIKSLVSYVFQNTNFKKLYLKTLDWNFRAQSCFSKCGFIAYNKLDRDGYTFILMEIPRERWQKLETEQEHNGQHPLTAGQLSGQTDTN